MINELNLSIFLTFLFLSFIFFQFEVIYPHLPVSGRHMLIWISAATIPPFIHV